MANKYTDILNITANGKNQMGLSNTIKRDYGIPLDFTSVQESYDAAIEYAATSTLAYVGQTVAVGAKLYIISDTANGTYIVGEGDSAVTYDNFLAEVGSKTEGDGNTIELDGQTLKLAGLTDLDNTKTYVPSLVNGKLVWAEPSATTVEGLDTRLQAVEGKVTTVESVLNGADGENGLVAAVAENTEAIAAEAEARANANEDILAKIGEIGDNTTVAAMIAAAEQAAKDYADANDADTIYDDTVLANRVTAVETAINDETTGLNKKVADNTAAISAEVTRATEAESQVLADAKEYTDAEIDGLSVAIEQKESVDYIVLRDKEGVEIASVNASKFVQDSFLDDVAYDSATGKITFTWSMGDGSTKTDEIDVSDLVDTYTAGNGLTLTDNEFAVDTTKIATVEALNAVSEVAEAAQTAQEVSDAIDTKIIAANLGQYAKATDVETALASKVDNTTYIADKETFAIKSEVETALGTKVSSETYAEDKAALQSAIDSKVSKISSEYEGEQIDWTLLSPENQAKLAALVIGEEGDIEVSGTVNAENVAGLGSWITTNRDSVAGLFAAADKTKLDGIEAGAEVNVIKTVKVNGTALTVDADRAVNIAVPTKFTDITDDSGFDARIIAAKDAADAAASAVTALEAGQVTTNKNDIAAVITRVGNIETQASTNNTNIATLTSTVNGLNTTVSSHTNKLTEIEAQLVVLGNKDTELDTAIKANTTEIAKKANVADVYLKTEVDAKVITSGEIVRGTTDSVSIADNKITVTLNSYTKSEVDDLLTNLDQTALETGIANNAADIAVLVGTDKDAATGRANKSIRTIAADEINTLIKAADPEGGKTIENINNLIAYVDENAGDIAELVTATGANTAKLAGIDTTVVAAIESAKEEAIAAIPALEVATAEKLGGVKSASGDNKVSVAADGVMSVATVNVNTLTQTSGDLLILDGGSAVV